MTKFFSMLYYIGEVIFAGAFMWVIFNLAIQIRIAVELSKGVLK